MYLSTYHANHWGEVDELLDLELPLFEPGFVYHQYFSHKKYATAYLNELYRPTSSVTLMFNLHYQHISYDMEQQQVGNFQGENLHSLEVNYNFFNPRVGMNVNLNKNVNLFANVSLSHREPTDSQLFDTWKGPDDLGVAPLFNHAEHIVKGGQLVRLFWTDPQVREERMMDYEAGVNYTGPRMALKLNLFFMDFHDEIVPYGQVDDDGFPVRGNADKTVHRGLELSGKFQINSNFELDTNLSLNDNYYKSFIYKEYDWNIGSVLEKDFSGNPIAGFPETIVNLTLTYRHSAIVASLRGQYFGRQFLDNTGQTSRSIDSSHLLNAWLKWNLPRIGRLERIELNLRVNNLSDEKIYTAGYYDAWAGENYLWPGAERNATLGMRLRY
jgi:iron complex outermembrane receptor protein